MIIWKDDMPFIVRDIEDLKQIIEEDVFKAIEEFIEEYVDNSEEVAELNGEISDLEDEIRGWENECSDLENALEQLKEKYGEHKGILPLLKDFMDVVDDAKLSKDQAYYWVRLKDAVDDM